jgi:nucleotide-binding universal stress UspA family protein
MSHTMFKRIIIGVEERDGGRDAIELAERAADRDAAMTLVNVCSNAPTTWRGSSPIYEAVELQHAQDVLTGLRQTTGIDATLRPVAAATPGRGLHMVAEDENADLLVLGSSRRGLLGRVLLGDDTREALNGAPCPVMIAPAGYARDARPIGRIGVGYNGSPESEHALAFARGLASELGAQLSALEAVEIPTYAFTAAAVPFSVDFIDDMVDSALRRVSALPGVEPHASYGRPAEELAHFSASLDLLVVGSRGYGPLGRLVHGSTTSILIGTACCPLLVLTRGATKSASDKDMAGSASFQDQSAWVKSTLAPR